MYAGGSIKKSSLNTLQNDLDKSNQTKLRKVIILFAQSKAQRAKTFSLWYYLVI